MIIIGDDQFKTVIEKYLDSTQFQHFDLTTFEVAQIEYRQLAIIDEESLIKMELDVKKKVSKLPAVIIYQKEDNELPFYFSNFILKFQPGDDVSFLKNNITIWERQLQQEEFMRSHFVSLQQELISMTESMNSQMSKIKKIYEIQIPLRRLKLKGAEIISKYSVGEDRGSEYFDFFKAENKVYIFMTHTQSYLTSALMMKLFQAEKENPVWENDKQIEFLSKLQSEVHELDTSQKQNSDTQVFLAELDLRTYELIGFNLGEFRLTSSMNHDIQSKKRNLMSLPDDALFKVKLKRGERFLIHSIGFEKSWSQSSSKELIDNIVNNKSLGTQEVVDELFFNVKQDSDSSFTSFDCSVVFMEVASNAFIKL